MDTHELPGHLDELRDLYMNVHELPHANDGDCPAVYDDDLNRPRPQDQMHARRLNPDCPACQRIATIRLQYGSVEDARTAAHDLTAAYLAQMDAVLANAGLRRAAPGLQPALTTLRHIHQREIAPVCDDRR